MNLPFRRRRTDKEDDDMVDDPSDGCVTILVGAGLLCEAEYCAVVDDWEECVCYMKQNIISPPMDGQECVIHQTMFMLSSITYS
jgi:hypothetical protein